MATELHFHCIFSLEKRTFVITVDHTKSYDLNPNEMKASIEDLEAQLAVNDQDFNLSLGNDKGFIRFKGTNGSQIVTYLRRVYDGWHHGTFANDGQNRNKPNK